MGGNVCSLKTCLASGVPFVFGIAVYQSFETPIAAASGLIPMPKPSETYLGGHALIAVGYDDQTHEFLVRNSWSTRWGIDGYCWIPYDYLTNPHLASDFWAIQVVAVK
jgi:C1A family cysteine protease